MLYKCLINYMFLAKNEAQTSIFRFPDFFIILVNSE